MVIILNFDLSRQKIEKYSLFFKKLKNKEYQLKRRNTNKFINRNGQK